jgi:hypothetical protein
MTVQEFYANRVRPLPPGDRLRLASLILGDLAGADAPSVDVSDAWSDEDLADLTAMSLRHAEHVDPWEPDDAELG